MFFCFFVAGLQLLSIWELRWWWWWWRHVLRPVGSYFCAVTRGLWLFELSSLGYEWFWLDDLLIWGYIAGSGNNVNDMWSCGLGRPGVGMKDVWLLISLMALGCLAGLVIFLAGNQKLGEHSARIDSMLGRPPDSQGKRRPSSLDIFTPHQSHCHFFLPFACLYLHIALPCPYTKARFRCNTTVIKAWFSPASELSQFIESCISQNSLICLF